MKWLGVPQSNFMPGRNAAQVQTVIIHTMVGTLLSANNRFQNPTAQVSAHYGVQLDGSVVQWVREADTAYHAGDWSVNLTSVGIEHEDSGNYDGPRTDALYAASAALVADICSRHNIPIDRTHIKGHREVHATACPDALDIDRIVRQAQEAIIETPQQTYDRIAPLLQANIVAPQENTNKALKAALAVVAAAADNVSDAELRVILTKVGVALQSLGAK